MCRAWRTNSTFEENQRTFTNKTFGKKKRIVFFSFSMVRVFYSSTKLLFRNSCSPYNSTSVHSYANFLSSTFSRVKIIIFILFCFLFVFFATWEFHYFFLFFSPLHTYTIKNVIRIKGWQKIPNFAKVIIFISQNLGIFSACFSFFAIYFSLKTLLFFFFFFAAIEWNTKTAFRITMKKLNKFKKCYSTLYGR